MTAKRHRAKFILFLIVVIVGTGWGLSRAQEMPKNNPGAPLAGPAVPANAPVEVHFTASDAIRIAKLRSAIQDYNTQIMTILKNYPTGENGEFIEDADHNWIGIRKAEAKKP